MNRGEQVFYRIGYLSGYAVAAVAFLNMPSTPAALWFIGGAGIYHALRLVWALRS